MQKLPRNVEEFIFLSPHQSVADLSSIQSDDRIVSLVQQNIDFHHVLLHDL